MEQLAGKKEKLMDDCSSGAWEGFVGEERGEDVTVKNIMNYALTVDDVNCARIDGAAGAASNFLPTQDEFFVFCYGHRN